MFRHVRIQAMQDYAQGRLNDRQISKVEAHFRECPECLRKVHKILKEVHEKPSSLCSIYDREGHDGDMVPCIACKELVCSRHRQSTIEFMKKSDELWKRLNQANSAAVRQSQICYNCILDITMLFSESKIGDLAVVQGSKRPFYISEERRTFVEKLLANITD